MLPGGRLHSRIVTDIGELAAPEPRWWGLWERCAATPFSAPPPNVSFRLGSIAQLRRLTDAYVDGIEPRTTQRLDREEFATAARRAGLELLRCGNAPLRCWDGRLLHAQRPALEPGN